MRVGGLSRLGLVLLAVIGFYVAGIAGSSNCVKWFSVEFSAKSASETSVLLEVTVRVLDARSIQQVTASCECLQLDLSRVESPSELVYSARLDRTALREGVVPGVILTGQGGLRQFFPIPRKLLAPTTS